MSNDASTYTGKTTFVGINGVGFSYFSSIGNLGEASSLGAPTTVADGTVTFKQANNYSDNVVYTGSGNTSDRGWDMRGNGANLRNRGTGTLSISGDVFVNSSSTFAADDADIELLGVLNGANYDFNGGVGRKITLGGANTFTGGATMETITVGVSVLADEGTVSSL